MAGQIRVGCERRGVRGGCRGRKSVCGGVEVLRKAVWREGLHVTTSFPGGEQEGRTTSVGRAGLHSVREDGAGRGAGRGGCI
jgi:hypothetical protein